jgi:hypothetical protein
VRRSISFASRSEGGKPFERRGPRGRRSGFVAHAACKPSGRRGGKHKNGEQQQIGGRRDAQRVDGFDEKEIVGGEGAQRGDNAARQPKPQRRHQHADQKQQRQACGRQEVRRERRQRGDGCDDRGSGRDCAALRADGCDVRIGRRRGRRAAHRLPVCGRQACFVYRLYAFFTAAPRNPRRIFTRCARSSGGGPLYPGPLEPS